MLDETQALGVLAQRAAHTALMRQSHAPWPPAQPPSLPQGSGRFLNETQSLVLLAAHGIPVVAHRLCRTAAEARDAWGAVGGPAVVKACAGDMPHESEHALVALHVDSANAAAALFDTQWARLAELGATREGVPVAAMHEGRHAFMAGARQDPVFGPVVVVGDGGKHVQALQDIAVLIPPFGSADVHAALKTLRVAPLLDGVRGEPPFDAAALCAVVIALGRLSWRAYFHCFSSFTHNPPGRRPGSMKASTTLPRTVETLFLKPFTGRAWPNAMDPPQKTAPSFGAPK